MSKHYNNYNYSNILDEIDRVGEATVRRDLSSFACPPSPKIENFIRNRAIDSHAGKSL